MQKLKNQEYMKTADLVPYANNAKIHTAEQVEQIKESIKRFGMIDPIAIWKGNVVVEGHGRLLACQELGIEEVPIIRLDHLTDKERKEYALIHNKLTNNTGFDNDLVDIELDEIGDDIDMSVFGFDIAEYEEDGDRDTEPAPSNFNYKEQYGVIVMCSDENEQEQVYNDLTESGYECKVVAV